MKTKTLFLAMLIAVSTTALAFGNDKPKMTVVVVNGSEVIKVIYKGASPGNVDLNVFDGRGNRIHSNTIEGLNGFIYPLNFKALQSGNYTIELVDNSGKYKENFYYKPASDYKSIHVSKLVNEEGKFLLAVSDVRDEPIRVKIFDDAQRVVYDESKTLAGDFAQVFKMERAYGRYTFEVSDARGNTKYFRF